MKKLVALLLVLVLTLPLCLPVALADEDYSPEDELAALFFLAALESAAEDYENNQNSNRSSSKSKSPSVPASTAPVTAVNPYYANVKTNGGVLNVRNKANKGATILLKLSNGSQLLVKGYTGSWLQVEVNGVTGFVPSRYVTGAISTTNTAAAVAQQAMPQTQQQVQYYAIVNPANNFVNMRSAPNTNSTVVNVYYYGYRLRVVAQLGDWCQVYDEATGLSGYMASRFLLVDNSVAVGNNG